ncbi:MAG TPA: hypothetical protein PLB55_02890 [Prosthecobacter sp.]|nr:hypothetical protein [Prosthecobacter sp.]
MTRDEAFKEFMDGWLARQSVDMADFDALMDLVLVLAERAGVTELDDVPLRDWWRRRSRERLEMLLLEFEDKNPAVAAHLQKLLDDGGHDPFADEEERSS